MKGKIFLKKEGRFILFILNLILNLLRKFHNNQDLCKYCQYMGTCLKN